MPSYLKLIGVVIVVLGLALRLRPTLVVLAAGLVTGLVAGIPLYLPEGAAIPAGAVRAPEGVLNMLGRAFAENRLMTLFIITLPAIGLAERHGLQEQAAALIRRVRAATVGRLQLVYQLFRVLVGALGIRLNGHPAFVRPLIFPMSLGAAAAERGLDSPEALPPDEVEEIKAATSAAENYGNFYGQNLSPVQPGILLVYGVLAGLGYKVGLWRLVLFAIPVTTLSVLLAAAQFALLDRRARRRRAPAGR
ncbi:MAG TPA: DUF969 family protein [Gemmatimonadaceae bacterium]|nr:DUF969 family protein [Gemmatimonadaceae bacterium]